MVAPTLKESAEVDSIFQRIDDDFAQQQVQKNGQADFDVEALMGQAGSLFGDLASALAGNTRHEASPASRQDSRSNTLTTEVVSIQNKLPKPLQLDAKVSRIY